jgi:hypothetical protein
VAQPGTRPYLPDIRQYRQFHYLKRLRPVVYMLARCTEDVIAHLAIGILNMILVYH